MTLNIGGPFPRWQILLGWAVLGLALIIWPHPFLERSNPLGLISEGIGIAVLSSAILGFTIERWLRSDLSKDVFLTSIAYHLPTEYREALRSQLSRLAGYKYVCDHHILKIKIEEIDDQNVRVTSACERTFKNISNYTLPLAGAVSIEEWNSPIEKSTIVECQIKFVGDNETKTFKLPIVGPNGTVTASTEEIKLKPKQAAEFSMKTTEIKRRTDEHWDNYSCPTYKPVIDVDHPSNFGIEISFGPDNDPIHPERYTGRKTLDGMYWPLQRMRVRWWPLGAFDKT